MSRISDMIGREANESWEQYCERKVLESQDKIRVYRGMTAIIPLLRALSDVGDIDSILDVMALCTYNGARGALVDWLRRNCGSDGVAPILRAFDTYSL